jgi:hypothetical protein
MRLRDLNYKKPLQENIGGDIPMGIRRTLPATFVIPDLDSFYEYYRFVTALACYPDMGDEFKSDLMMKDMPLLVAYTPQEEETIKAVAKRLGYEAKDISFGRPQEEDGANTVSPVMKFNMTEAELDCLRALTEYVLGKTPL